METMLSGDTMGRGSPGYLKDGWDWQRWFSAHPLAIDDAYLMAHDPQADVAMRLFDGGCIDAAYAALGLGEPVTEKREAVLSPV